eukprot:227590-Prorocentrum_minimum.AAC.1
MGDPRHVIGERRNILSPEGDPRHVIGERRNIPLPEDKQPLQEGHHLNARPVLHVVGAALAEVAVARPHHVP